MGKGTATKKVANSVNNYGFGKSTLMEFNKSTYL